MSPQDISQAMVPDTVVGPTVKIQGDLNSDGNILIEGQVIGTVSTTQIVRVGEHAKITANVAAANAAIAGEVKGNLVISEQLTLMSSAKISGDIQCNSLKIEEGAFFNGKCSMGGQVKVSAEAVADLKNDPEEKRKTSAAGAVKV